MKTCFKCNKTKPLSEFYKHPAMSDGHLNKCKICNRIDSEKRRMEKSKDLKWVELELARHREKARKYRESGIKKKRNKESILKWNEKNKIKLDCRSLVASAIKSGRLTKSPCGICGNKKVDAHHEDYYKPLDVVWLCRKHHMERHVEINKIKRAEKFK